MSFIYGLSFLLGLTTVATVYIALWVLALPWRERVGLAMLGAGTLFSFWMGLIPRGHLETWPFLLGRAGIIMLLEAIYGKRVRARIAAQWTIGKLADVAATDREADILAAAFMAPPAEYQRTSLPGATLLPKTEKK